MSAMKELNGLPRIPPTWSWSTIKEACLKVQDGTHFSPQNQLTQGAYKYITAKNVRPSGLDLSNVSYLAEDEHRAIYKRCDPKRGDVLLVKDGVNTGDAAVNTLDEEFSLLSSVCLLRPRPALLYSQFLRYYLLSPVGYRMLTGQMTGTAIKRIILGRIKESLVPIAPLDEQRTIVAEIEKQFSRLDEAVANLKRVKANLKRYKASILKAAVEGKLVPIKDRQTTKIDEVADIVTKGSSPNWQGFNYTDRGVVFVRSQNVGWGNLDLSDVAHLPPAFNEKERKSVLKTGDVLLNIVGASIGRAALATSEIEGGNVNQAVAVIRLNQERMLPKFLMLNLLSPVTQAAIHAEKVDVARANVSLSDIKEFSVLHPSLQEQSNIVAEVERRLSVIDELEVTVEANLTRADRLRQAILKRAFEGKLITAKHLQQFDLPGEPPLAAESSSAYGATR